MFCPLWRTSASTHFKNMNFIYLFFSFFLFYFHFLFLFLIWISFFHFLNFIYQIFLEPQSVALSRQCLFVWSLHKNRVNLIIILAKAEKWSLKLATKWIQIPNDCKKSYGQNQNTNFFGIYPIRVIILASPFAVCIRWWKDQKWNPSKPSDSKIKSDKTVGYKN